MPTEMACLIGMRLLLENAMGVPVRGSVVGFGYVGLRHIAGVVVLSVFVVSACFSQVQKSGSYGEGDFQLPDAPSALRVPDATKYFHLFEKTSSSYSVPNDSRAPLWLSSSSRRIQDRPTPNRHGLQYESAGKVGLVPGDAHAILNPRAGRLAFAPIQAEPATAHSADDWQYYAHRIPVAGPVVRRVGEQAQAHPRVVMVFKVIQPQF